MSTIARRDDIHANPVRGPLNAAFFDLMDGYLDRKFGKTKRALFADLPDTVVELGSGTGANFRYLREGTHLIAVEPNIHMHPALERNARDAGIVLEVLTGGAERIDLPDSSVEAVICTLVLCTVQDPARALAEVRRILKPGGRFLCLEHVHAAPDSSLRTLQHAIRAPWRWAFEGCDLCRDTGPMLREAGFRDVQIEELHSDTIFVPIRPLIVAACTR
jgi:SAM-dependent methyltransferase